MAVGPGEAVPTTLAVGEIHMLVPTVARGVGVKLANMKWPPLQVAGRGEVGAAATVRHKSSIRARVIGGVRPSWPLTLLAIW